MQKLLNNYSQVVLWTIVFLLIAAPAYVVYDLAIRQPAKVEALQEAYVATGSFQFASNQCWRCHGYNGEGGIGLPLNKTEDIRAREAKDPFIIKTITRGRPGTQMPTWGKSEGGPLDSEQIVALRAFILDGTHWGTYYDEQPVVCNEDHTKVIEGVLGTKAWKPTKDYLQDHCLVPPAPPTPEGHGQIIVTTGPCSACHEITDKTKIGPGLLGIFQLDKLPNGKPVNDDNVREWIKKGSATYKTEGAPFMPPYETQVSDNDITDIIAYLKTLKK